MIDPELEKQFYAQQRSSQMPLVVGDSVELAAGPNKGRRGSVISLVPGEALRYLIEPSDSPYEDIEIAFEDLRLANE